MVKIKVSNFLIDSSKPSSELSELEIQALIINQTKGDETFEKKSIKDDYLILMSEFEYREKMSARSAKKLNPLMLNFEEYE